MILYRDARPTDASALAEMAAQSFMETFARLYSDADLAAFLESVFAPAVLHAQTADPAYAIRLAIDVIGDEEAIVGFAKLGPCVLPDPARDAAELHQLYILKPWQGTGIAATLMEWAIDVARTQGARDFVLGVFSDNIRAQRFYARYGLSEIGRYGFRVGEQLDDERIWSRTL